METTNKRQRQAEGSYQTDSSVQKEAECPLSNSYMLLLYQLGVEYQLHYVPSREVLDVLAPCLKLSHLSRQQQWEDVLKLLPERGVNTGEYLLALPRKTHHLYNTLRRCVERGQWRGYKFLPPKQPMSVDRVLVLQSLNEIQATLLPRCK